MKNPVFPALTCISFFIFSCSGSRYTVANAHAHNDYAHPVPFFTAWNAGFGSIEADVFVVKDSLYVAHDTPISVHRAAFSDYTSSHCFMRWKIIINAR